MTAPLPRPLPAMSAKPASAGKASSGAKPAYRQKANTGPVDKPTEEGAVTIHTDGSCLGNPGRGGWAAKLVYGDHVKRLSGGFQKTTNNRMEILSSIMALSQLSRPCSVDLYSDSRYLCDAVSKGWLYNWLKKGWVKSDKKPVLNRDLWERLLPLLKKHSVRFHWVEGHAGHADNEEVDELARTAASAPDLPPDTGFEKEEG